jgi:hypothetical protein
LNSLPVAITDVTAPVGIASILSGVLDVVDGEATHMKTLRNPNDKEEILRRLQSIQPGSERRWGKMSAHQMICHLSDGYKMYIGEKKVQPAAGLVRPAFLRWIAIWVPMPWPRGFPTAPELDQERGGTPPAQFEADMRELRGLLERLTRRPRDFQWQPHPHFGQMSDASWMRLAFLHANHHLRQFGA